MSLRQPEGQRSGRPKLHFAMLTYGALDATRRCVRSLAATTGREFQLFIVDNASADETPSWLRAQREPWLHHRINTDNRGVPGGRNDLVDFVLDHRDDHDRGDEDWIVFIDNDLEFRPGWIDPFLQAMQRYPNARVLGKVGHFIQLHDDGRTLFPAPTTTSHVDVVSGGFACFVRVDAARAVGGFDEQLGKFWHEDDDYCVRALQLGFEVVAVPEAAIEHHEHASGVAIPDLESGGSSRNLRYLAEKWCAAGHVDRDGWIIRRDGPYLPPAVRDELRRRMTRRGPIGRTELASAIQLLEQLVEQPQPVRWLGVDRRPIPACTSALLALFREQAEQTNDRQLVTQLTDVARALDRASNTRLLRDMVPAIGTSRSAPAGQGVCRDADFDDEQFLQVAEELGLANLARDPYARSAVLWESIAIALQLRGAGLPRPGARVLCVGDAPHEIATWLTRAGTTVRRATHDEGAGERHDAILFVGQHDPDLVNETVAAHASTDTTVILCGTTALNGVPAINAPQPHQLELDILSRARLRAVADIAVQVDDPVLEACATAAGTVQWPMLSWIAGAQVLTQFVVAARKTAEETTHVIVPASPLAKATLRVGVDLRTLFHADSAARGIGKFTVQHLSALVDSEPGLRVIGYTQQDRVDLPVALRRAGIRTRAIDSYRPGDCDLVHVPDPMNMSFGFDSPLRVLRHPRTTVTFHDLTPLHRYIEHWPRPNREGYLDRLRQIERGDCHLLCNSRFTAQDVLEHTRVAPRRVTPILAGLHHDGGPTPSPAQIAAVHESLGIRGPFVLHVGALDPHKNFHAALNAFLMARSRRPLQLVVVGAVDPGTTQAASFCALRKVPDVSFTGYLPRAHLDALYASAVGLLFLSRAEGFGLPILEAMAKGCPVIASNATSHPEVAGDACLLVDPDDQAAAARGIEQLLGDPALRDEMRRRGHEQARAFPWRAVAERTLAVWHAMAEVVASESPMTPMTTA